VALARARGTPRAIAADVDVVMDALRTATLTATLGAWALAAAGRHAEARENLGQLQLQLTFVRGRYPVAMYGADAAIMLGDRVLAARLYALLEEHRHVNAVHWGIPTPGPVFGPTALVLADLAAFLGQVDDARRLYAEAIEVAERLGGVPFVALARRGLDVLGGASPSSRPSSQPPSTRAPAHVSREPEPAIAVLSRTGDYWSLTHEGRTHALRARRGLEHLACLLAEPDRERHVLDLSASDGGASDRVVEVRDAVLDPKAKAAYRARIDALREVVLEAERYGDTARAERARSEIDAIASELAGAFGVGGRDRSMTTSVDRARAAVTLAIRRAIDAIADVEGVLGGPEVAAVKTGVFCSYRPDPSARISWRVTS
jgi:hypothetical protein